MDFKDNAAFIPNGNRFHTEFSKTYLKDHDI